MKKSYLKKGLFLFFLFSFSIQISAQNITNYFPSDGLIEGGIYTTIEDHNNDIWVGSWTNPVGTPGLAKFDGTDWIQFTTEDGLIGDNIRVLFHDSANNLWIGTTEGVTFFDYSSVTNYTTDNGLVDNYVFDIIEDDIGNIWIATNGGISKFDGSTWVNYTTADNEALYAINKIVKDHNGDLWIASVGGGVIKFDGSTWINFTAENSGLAANDVFTMYQDSNNNYWFGSYFGDGGLTFFDGSNWIVYGTDDGLPTARIRAITEDNFGDLWIGSNAGATKFDGYELTTYTTSEGLLNGGVRSFFQDSNDDLWVGTWASGISKVEISKVYIPDEIFEKSLIQIGMDSDNIINHQVLRKDVFEVTELILTNPLSETNPLFHNELIDLDPLTERITDLTGIEAFVGLIKLGLGYSDLASVDLSFNKELDDLFLNDGQLIEIDVYKNTKLRRFGVLRNPDIGSLDVSNNIILEELFVDGTAMTSIDVSMNTNLWKFYGRWGNLTGIDLSENTNLRDVRLRGSSNLTYVNVKNGNNSNITGFDVRDMPSLTCVTADGIAVPEVSQLMLNFSNGLLSTDCGTVYIPDANFELALINQGIDVIGIQDHIILETEAVTQTSLNVSSSSITDITGIEAFSGLTALAIHDNQISTIDLSNNTSLEGLYFNDNQISSLDLTNQNNLSFLNIDRNNTEELILGNHPNLSVILGSGNALKSIDVTNCPALITLSLGGSQLTSLDVTGNSLLEEIVVHWNLLTEFDISSNPNVSFLLCEGNQLTSLNIANGNNLNFIKPASATYTEYSFNALYNNNLECIQVDADMFSNIPTDWIKEANTIYSSDCATKPEYVSIPDSNFEQSLIDIGIDSDGVVNSYILKSEAEAVTELNLNVEALAAPHPYGTDTGNPLITNVTEPILDLTGIEAFTGLTNLSCGYHAINSIDVSNNTSLTKLELANNQLTAVDVTGLVNLTFLNLIQNQISSIDVKNNIELEVLWLESNLLTGTGTDISLNTKLENIAFGYNQITSLDVSNNLELWAITSEGTNLTTIDVSNNLNLKSLWVFDSPNFNYLDVSKNALLNRLGIWNTSIVTLDLSNNPITGLWANNTNLTHLDMRNGNNSNVSTFQTKWGTPNLTCINVDDETADYLSDTTIWKVDQRAGFRNDCGDFVYIPDPNFEQALIDIGIDSDGVVNTSILRTDAEDPSLTSLNLNNTLFTPDGYGFNNDDILNVTGKIADLTGIEAFVNLTNLQISYSDLTTVNVANNLELQELWITDGILEGIDVTSNTDLLRLGVMRNNIEGTIDISQNINLKWFLAYNNLLSSVNVLANTELTNLRINNNAILELDVSQNTLLERLDAQYNTGLNLSTDDYVYDSLFSLNLSGIGLTGFFNGTQVPNIQWLLLSDNDLSQLSLSQNHSLANLYLNNNPNLSHLDLRNGNNEFLNRFDVSGTPLLTCINADGIDLPDISQKMKDSEKSFSVDCGDFVYIPDPNFEQSLIDIGIDSDGVVNTSILREDAEAVTDLNLNNSLFTPVWYGFNNPDIKNVEGKIGSFDGTLEGIQAFINLTHLQASYSDLTTINVSNNVALQELWVTDGILTGIDVRNNTNLIKLGVSANNISETVDVSLNSFLEWLIIGYNPITSLDLMSNTSLWYLWVPGTQITSLDITPNTNLQRLDAQYNPGLSLISDPAGYPAMRSLNLSGTGLSNYNLYAPLFPNLQWLLLNDNSLTRFNGNNALLVEHLFLNNNNIDKLVLSSNTALKELNANDNVLTQLDVRNTNNIDLQILNVTGNLLTCISVDDPTNGTLPYASWNIDLGVILSANCGAEPEVILIPDANFEAALSLYDTNGINGNILVTDAEAVTNLDVSGNNILYLTGIEGFVNLTDLNVSDNLLNTINLLENTNLVNLDVSGNNLSELFVNSGRDLVSLNANDNQLTTLNVVGFDNIETLNIAMNMFETIDVSGLASLSIFNATDNPNLLCIGVDDPNNIPAGWSKDETANYSNNPDCISPTIVAQDVTIFLNDKGEASVDPNDFDNGSTDNVSANADLTFSVVTTDFTCSDLGGPIIIELTVTDEAGNSAFQDVSLYVEDNIAPTVSANPTFSYDLNGMSAFNLDPLDILKSSKDNCDTITYDVDQSLFSSPGTYTVTLMAIDGSGNIAEDTTEVEITDSQGSAELKFGGTTATVYPIPIGDQLNILFSKSVVLNSVSAQLIDLMGTIYPITLSPNNGNGNFVSGDTSSVPTGNYVLQVTLGNKTDSDTVVKE